MEKPLVEETETSDEGKDLEKPQRTEREIAEYNLKKKAEEARALGLSPEDVLGLKPKLKVDDTLSDDTPLTVGALREIQKQDAKKTALELADAIEDAGERNETRAILERLAPSGDAHADLSLARSAVGAKRTAMLAEDEARKTKAKQTASGGSADGKHEDEFILTEQERIFMGNPYNLSKEQILEARKRSVSI